MPLTLVIEDGSGVSGANSYDTLAEIKAFALARNIDLSSFDGSILIGYAILAIDYLESFRNQYKGTKTNATQALQWPRTINLTQSVWSEFSVIKPNVLIDGFDVLPNQIPVNIKYAQAQLVIEQSNGITIFPVGSPNRIVKSRTIGPLKTEFFPGADNFPLMPSVDAFMEPLLSQGGASIRTIRV